MEHSIEADRDYWVSAYKDLCAANDRDILRISQRLAAVLEKKVTAEITLQRILAHAVRLEGHAEAIYNRANFYSFSTNQISLDEICRIRDHADSIMDEAHIIECKEREYFYPGEEDE